MDATLAATSDGRFADARRLVAAVASFAVLRGGAALAPAALAVTDTRTWVAVVGLDTTGALGSFGTTLSTATAFAVFDGALGLVGCFGALGGGDSDVFVGRVDAQKIQEGVRSVDRRIDAEVRAVVHARAQ